MSATTGATGKTGATDEQIEAAAREEWDDHCEQKWADLGDETRKSAVADADYWAPYLVPPDALIVPLATHNALVAFANAEAAYRAARRTLAGFEAEWRAREAAWEVLGKVGR